MNGNSVVYLSIKIIITKRQMRISYQANNIFFQYLQLECELLNN